MTVEFEVSTDVNRPPEDVFEYLTDPANVVEWNSQAIEVPPVEEDMDVGTTWRPVVKGITGPSELPMECTVYEPPNRFGYRTTTGLLGDRVHNTGAEYSCTPQGDQTRLAWAGTIETKGVAKLLEPVLARMLRKDVESSLEKVKRVMEQDEN
jgi:uncharacterized protein YndB with AHSA1/START domain